MTLNFLINKPMDEYKLFLEVAIEVKDHFQYFFGDTHYIHLVPVNSRMSYIDEIKTFKIPEEAGYYTYVKRDNEACILLRSNERSISMLLCGESDYACAIVTLEKIYITDGPAKSTLSFSRNCGLTSIEKMQAFGVINDSLQELKGNKSS